MLVTGEFLVSAGTNSGGEVEDRRKTCVVRAGTGPSLYPRSEADKAKGVQGAHTGRIPRVPWREGADGSGECYMGSAGCGTV